MSKKKYYVVWEGAKPGIYESWEECQKQISGYKAAKYKSFKTIESAKQAFKDNYSNYINNKEIKQNKETNTLFPDKPDYNSISVDAACSGNPGIMEYRGVDTKTKETIFKQGPFKNGTNNIGEFLALVHGLAYLKKINSNKPVYSDSATAISWVKKKQCKTKLEESELNKELFDLIKRAENWLKTNTYKTKILKWETKIWGEIPADFGRK